MNGFILDGQRYPWAALETLTIGEQIRLEHWLKGQGSAYTDARTYDDVLAIAVEVDSLGDYTEQQKHPEFKFSLSVALWMAKRAAGEEVTPSDCMAWTWDRLDFWDDDEGKG